LDPIPNLWVMLIDQFDNYNNDLNQKINDNNLYLLRSIYSKNNQIKVQWQYKEVYRQDHAGLIFDITNSNFLVF
jgi:regulation of enolase protein 1 (concanavalin A-like superfamily)